MSANTVQGMPPAGIYVDESGDADIYLFPPGDAIERELPGRKAITPEQHAEALRRWREFADRVRAHSESIREVYSDLGEVIRRGTQDMQAIADALEAQRKKKPPMWAQDPTKSKRPIKGRGHRRVK